MESCDVLIVGGGPAGSSVAWSLRRSGLEVVVWDGRRFPRDKVCAGWITPQVLDDLDLDPTEYAGGRVLQPIRGFRVGRTGGREASVAYDSVVSYGIRRCEFDDYLLRRSEARLRLGEPVREIRRTPEGWVVNGRMRARMLVGAGGHFCPVARFLGARPGASEPIIAAQEVELRMSPDEGRRCEVGRATPEILFTADLKGYGWVFRKGPFVNIGLGRQDPTDLSRHVRSFVTDLERRGRIPSGMTLDWRGHAYLLYGEATRRLCDDNVLLAGDAAGLAYPYSGEGIRPAIESGLLAGRTVLEAGGHYECEALGVYERRLADRLGPRDAGVRLPFLRLLPDRALRAIAAKLLASRWFVRRVVLDRWFFHAADPPLKPDRIGLGEAHPQAACGTA
jgi:geranylgeranyl reductase family protein